MLDLALNDQYIIELFSFPDPPKRPTYPEACGLRHLAFAVDSVAETLEELRAQGVKTTELQVDAKDREAHGIFL